MKINKTIRTEVTEEIEINFPYYFKTGGCYFALEREDLAIEVTDTQVCKWAFSSTLSYQLGKADATEITRGEFITAFDRTIESLQQLAKTTIS